VAPKVRLLVLLAALLGALAAVLWASVREALAKAPAQEEGFEVESFLPPSSNGADRETTAAELDRWLDEPRATELS
jgi:hypothetical protein